MIPSKICLVLLFSIYQIYVDCETCDEGHKALDLIKFKDCENDLNKKYFLDAHISDSNGSTCAYAKALFDKCVPHYENCYSGQSLIDLKKLWLRQRIQFSCIYDQHLVASECEYFNSIFSKDELEEIQEEIPLLYDKDRNCKYILDYNAMIDPSYNSLADIMRCENKCSNDSKIALVKDEFEKCKPGGASPRDTLWHESKSVRYRLTCGHFVKFVDECSPILDECLSSVTKEIILGEELYMMSLGVLDGIQLLDEDDSFVIEDCAFFGGHISMTTTLKSMVYILIISNILSFLSYF